MNAHQFLVASTTVLCVAALTTVVFQRLKQPVVLGYILAGFIVGPNVPFPVAADREVVQTLSEIGVILLMFSLGLEFSLSKLVKLGPVVSLTAVLQSSLMFWLGFVTGRFFGWTTIESLFAGATIAISSTTIIAKTFDEQKVRGALRELVVGILIVEDLIAILLMAMLTAIGSGRGLSAVTMARTSAKLALFLVGLVVIGLLLVPRGVRAIRRLQRPETTLVAAVGFCFATSLLAHALGYSVALGAFIAGSLIAESGEQREIEHLVEPVRDVFAAIFFVSVGMLIDPALIIEHLPAIAALTALVILGKLVGVSLGAFLTGNSVRTSVQAGMSLAQIGEFSFIIAGLGLSLRATREFLYPVAVAVSALTTLTTPWLIRASGPVANFVDRKMPRPLQTFVTLYATWLEQLRTEPRSTARGARIRRLIRLLVVDAVLLIAIAVGSSLALPHLSGQLERRLDMDPRYARGVVLTAALILTLPLSAGIVRVARRLGLTLASAALPEPSEGSVDLGAAPRRAFVVTLQFAIVLLTGLPILMVTQPVLGGAYGAFLLGVLLLGLGISFWKGATDLHGHVQAGAQTMIEALLTQAHQSRSSELPSEPRSSFEQIQKLFTGLGSPVAVSLDEHSSAVGKSLAQLNLRGITGATVLAITRDGKGTVIPGAREVLRAGDRLALAGSQESINAAKDLLTVGREAAE